MRHRVWIRYEDEVDVELTDNQLREWWIEAFRAPDCTGATGTDGETMQTFYSLLNIWHRFVEVAPDEMLAELPAEPREILIADAKKWARRLEETAPTPAPEAGS